MAYSHEHLHRRHAKQQEAAMEDLIKREPAPEPQTTVLSVVYVTADPTFTGSIGGYTTLGDPVGASATSDTGAAASSSTIGDFSSPASTSGPEDGFITVTGLVGTSSRSSFSTASSESAVTSALVGSAITSTAAISHFSTSTQLTAVAAASASASSSSSASISPGMSTGGKIGIAVGVIILLVAVAGGVLFAYWKKKKQQEEYSRQDDEKAALAASAAAANKAPSPAPRLSLRPMSRLMRFSGGNLLNNVNAPNAAQNGPGRTLTPSPNMAAAGDARAPSPWERKADAGPQNANNPFNDPQNPFSDPEKGISPPPAAESAAMAAAAGGAMARKITNEAPRRPSPEPMAPAAAAANSPDVPSNVHRVQIDFKPSMDDELELKAGQLVRMLHEYDDGWALCIRLDRSQQGVAPRTCLSVKPCKPRPAAGPNGPGPRGPGMNGAPTGRMLPAVGAPNGRMSPAMGAPNGRMSPAMGAPTGRMSPAMGPPNGRMSPAMGNGRMSPAMGRPGPPQGRPMSPMTPAGARGPPRMPAQQQSNNSSASINQFNQGPRPLSPGPGPRPSAKPRSQSPGPYGAQGPRSMAPPGQRRRSNSAGGALMPQGRMSPAPLNPSRLGPGAPGQWPLHANGGRPV